MVACDEDGGFSEEVDGADDSFGSDGAGLDSGSGSEAAMLSSGDLPSTGFGISKVERSSSASAKTPIVLPTGIPVVPEGTY